MREQGYPYSPGTPLAWFIGSLLVLADAAARTVAQPLEVPVGVVTALIGVPFFLVLLRRGYARKPL